MRRPVFNMLAGSAAALLLVACSSGASSSAEPANPSMASGPAAKAAPPAAAAAADVARVTASEKPFDAYRAPDGDALAWVGAYYAASGAAPDYPAVAARLDPVFQRTTDAFAQQDAIAGTKTKLDAAIAAAKANPYVRLPPVVARLPGYDLAHQRYDFADLIGPTMGLTVADGAAQIRFAPNPGLSGYAPANEAEARTLEHAIASNPLNRQIQYTVFGKVVGATLNGGTPELTVVPTRVVVENYLLDKPAELLFTATTP